MDNSVLAKSLGLADDATEEQITVALSAATEKASKADELAAEVETLKSSDKTEVETLREELATERAARISNEREQILAAAVSDGRMLPAEKESLVEVFGDNLEGLKKILDARPKNTTLAREQGAGGGGRSDVTDDVEALKFRNADGYDVDGESLSVHIRALELLGKDDYTESEYLAAADKAARELNVTA